MQGHKRYIALGHVVCYDKCGMGSVLTDTPL